MVAPRSVRSIAVALAALLAVLLAVAPAGAVINGQPDGARHSYVGLVIAPSESGVIGFSGSLVTPTVVVTSAHFFTEVGQVVYLTFDPRGAFGPDFADFPNNMLTGRWYPDPAFCLGCSGSLGLPDYDTHDVGVIVLDVPVVLERYAQLPSPGLVDTLTGKTQVEIVGYGAQDRPQTLDPDELFTRYVATANLSRSRPKAFADEFIKLSANPAQDKGGICFGDSGGPNLLAGTDTILGVNSFVTNGNCAGITYSYRIDTPEALAFINSFL